jgi:hypothetical protein
MEPKCVMFKHVDYVDVATMQDVWWYVDRKHFFIVDILVP